MHTARSRPLLVAAALLFLAGSAQAAEGRLVSPSPLAGNGFNMSFDGRVYIVRREGGWTVSVLRPQNVRYDANGPVLTEAFSDPTPILSPTHNENALAICEEDARATPYPCNAAGDRASAGPFACYDLTIIDSDALSERKDFQRRTLRLWIASPGTPSAELHHHEWMETRSAMSTTAGTRLRGIEPTVTRDGRLLIFQGHPSNDGATDILMYATNDNPCSLGGWHGPHPISHMHVDGRVRGRYRLAERQFRAADGTPYPDNSLVRGAYPWVFPEGDAISFTATTMPCRSPGDPTGCGPRRSGFSVIGYPTNWGLGHIDGAVNPSREDDVRLFFTSPGPIFNQLPLTGGIDVWPFFGTNTANYTELVFDDALDGGYAGVWHMNESVNSAGNFDLTRTPDSSGYFNTATVHGAASPPANNGLFGKAMIFDGDGDYLEVPHNTSLNPVNGLSVEMWLRPSEAVDCDSNNNYRFLLGKGQIGDGTYSLVIEDDMTLQGRVQVGGVQRIIRSGASIALHAWSHIGFTYEASNGRMRFFVNGAETSRVDHPPGTITPTSHPLRIGGPGGARSRCPHNDGSFHGAIDEVRISRVVRDLTLASRPGNFGELIAMEAPDSVHAGQSFTAEITYRNIGTTAWRPETLHRLGSQSPQDNERWGASRFALPRRPVHPGEQVTLVASLRAPSSPGSYPLQFDLLQEGVAWFGAATPLVNVNVSDAPPGSDAGPVPDAGPRDAGLVPGGSDAGPAPGGSDGGMAEDGGPDLDGGPDSSIPARTNDGLASGCAVGSMNSLGAGAWLLLFAALLGRRRRLG